MASNADSPRELILWTIVMTALAVIVLWSLYLAREILLLVYISALLAIGFAPVVRSIERKRLVWAGVRRFPRGLAILFVYAGLIAAVTLIGFIVFPPLVQQSQEMWGSLPDMLDRGQQFLIDRGLLNHRITLREAVAQAPTGSSAISRVVTTVAGIIGGVVGLITILILSFYFLVESDTIVTTFVRLFPRENRRALATALREITVKVSAWLNGQLILAGTIGSTAALGLWFLGVPYFYVLAVIAGVGEMIPILGPALSAIPAVAVALTVSVQKAVFVLIFFVLQQQIENHILVPRVMSRQVGVSPVTVIIALLFGGSLLGIAGAILAVPTAAALQVLFQQFVEQEDAQES